MAYCLRLPREATAMIDEIRAHWADLAPLRAAGGTPSARCLKGFEITSDVWSITITAKSSEVGVRRASFAAKNPCQYCAALMEADADEGGHCARCQIRWTVAQMRRNTIYFSRLERRGFSWR